MNVDISVTGLVLGLVLVAIVVGIIAMIVVLKNVYKKRTEEGIAGEYRENLSKSPLQNRAKYNRVDVFSLSGTFFNFGLALAFGLALLAFGWTQYEEQIFIPDGAMDIPDEIEMEPPRTAEPPPPPPPPPPPVIEEVPEEELIEEDPPEFTDQTIEDKT
ncbi:MAG: energy transducer TonB, partial [Saprospiraceae bacterium]